MYRFLSSCWTTVLGTLAYSVLVWKFKNQFNGILCCRQLLIFIGNFSQHLELDEDGNFEHLLCCEEEEEEENNEENEEEAENPAGEGGLVDKDKVSLPV